MKKFTNNTNISLSMAVFLATDTYDHNPDPNHISVTTLIKPLKKVILASRVKEGEMLPDISTRLKAQTGTAVHTAIEHAWETNYEQAMRDLGYPEGIINQIVINPSDEQIKALESSKKPYFPIYMERRSSKIVEGMKISGKFDFVCEGNLEDFKNTSTYTYITKSNDKDYILQGSIYRWLNQDIITGDYITIQYEFRDWSPMGLKRDPRNYPPKMQMAYKLRLMSIAETENYVRNKILDLKKYWNSPEIEIPPCSKEDLWQADSVWKYYKNPNKTNRSTANFTNMGDAYARHSKDGAVGLVKEFPSEPRACLYCDAFPVCNQRKNYNF